MEKNDIEEIPFLGIMVLSVLVGLIIAVTIGWILTKGCEFCSKEGIKMVGTIVIMTMFLIGYITYIGLRLVHNQHIIMKTINKGKKDEVGKNKK